MVCENYDSFINSNMQNQVSLIINGVYDNIALKKLDYNQLHKNYQMRNHERKKMNEVTNNEYEGVFIL